MNRAIKRNPERFPSEFMFQLTTEGVDSLRCQSGTSNIRRGGRRYLPYVFTEHGAFMAASVLNSPRAVEVSVFVVRAFVKLRQLVLAHKELAGKLDQLERKVGSHDEAIKQLVAAIRQLMAPATRRKKKWAFTRFATPPRSRRNCPDRPPRRSDRNAGDAPMLERFNNRQRCVVRVLVETLPPYKGRAYDPCCGSAGMFVRSEESVEEYDGRMGNLAVYWKKSNSTARRLAMMNLAIRGIEGNLGPVYADTFHRDLHKDLRADDVLGNPPFNDSDGKPTIPRSIALFNSIESLQRTPQRNLARM